MYGREFCLLAANSPSKGGCFPLHNFPSELKDIMFRKCRGNNKYSLTVPPYHAPIFGSALLSVMEPIRTDSEADPVQRYV